MHVMEIWNIMQTFDGTETSLTTNTWGGLISDHRNLLILDKVEEIHLFWILYVYMYSTSQNVDTLSFKGTHSDQSSHYAMIIHIIIIITKYAR